MDRSLVASARAVKILYNCIITTSDCQGRGISVRAFALARPGVGAATGLESFERSCDQFYCIEGKKRNKNLACHLLQRSSFFNPRDDRPMPALFVVISLAIPAFDDEHKGLVFSHNMRTPMQ